MLPVISHNYFDGLNYRWEVALCMLLSSWSLASNNKIKHKSQTDEQNNEKEMKCSTMKTSEFIEKLYTHDERQQSLGNSSKFWKSNPPRPFKLNLIHSKVRFFTIADTFCFFFYPECVIWCCLFRFIKAFFLTQFPTWRPGKQ